MAFLCPVRIRRSKKKGEIPPPPNFFPNVNNENAAVSPSPPGRITGSSSIETLVRVGLEKEAGPSASARMCVLHDFSPCVDDELGVRKGEVVSLLYREHDWAYVIDSKIPPNEGFIPFSFITPLKDPENNPLRSISTPFPKTPSDALYLNLYTFTASDENDLTLERGAVCTLMNDEDPDWFWVLGPNGEEGFVPSAFLHRLNPGENPTSSNSKSNHPCTSTEAVGESQPKSQPEKTTEKCTSSAGAGGGVELVMLYDYKAQAADDLSVKRGDWVHADLSVQTVTGWLWAYAPKQKKYGFIPNSYCKPPAMTSL